MRFATEEEAEEAEYKKRNGAEPVPAAKRNLVRLGWMDQTHIQGRCGKISKELLKSTARLSQPETSRAVAMEVAQLEKDMRCGMEPTHLKEVVRQTSVRGALLLGETNIEGGRYYPTRGAQSGASTIAAFNIMLRRGCENPKKHELRYLAIVDSMVSEP